MKTVTYTEFKAELRAQGVPTEHLAFTCPMCGTVQSATSLIRAGAGAGFEDVDRYLGFSCVGRWQGGPGPTEAKAKGVACNWTLGGLFQCHEYEVERDGELFPRFEPATPEAARALLDRNKEPQA